MWLVRGSARTAWRTSVKNDERNQIAGRVRKIADQGWPLTRVWVYDDDDDGLPYVYYLVRPLED